MRSVNDSVIAFLKLETLAPPTLDQSTVKKRGVLCKGEIIKQTFESSLFIQVITNQHTKAMFKVLFSSFSLLINYDNIDTRWHCDLQLLA